MARFFIDRPVFAWVIAIAIMLAGLLALRTLPIAQYPDIALPTISIAATYPGASAQAVEDSVTQIIEQRMTGLEGLDYFSSTSSSSGLSTITLTFKTGVDPDIAQVQVQNKLALATPLLPDAVQSQGVTVNKSSSGFLMVMALVSDNDRFDQTDLGDYMATNFVDQISRLDGVGETGLFGSEYAMRIWLNPEKLQQYNLQPSDVIAAIRAQNAQVSSGSLGGMPQAAGQEITATISLQSLLTSTEEFEALPIRSTTEGGSIVLSDVARVELGAASYASVARFNNKPAVGMRISLATGANAIDTAEGIRELVHELSPNLPEGVSVIYPYDSTPFVEASIEEVQKTLLEAIILVFLVIFVFLQSARATFVPMMAIPVVLLGTFAVLAALGYSINVLTMFAMVLAIGLLVDDAIVVVENVERVMEEEGLEPREATQKSMDEITGALIGIAVVLSAVFIPMAFFAGSTGVIYRQFSVTIVAAMVLSVIVAIVFSPALCASILKRHVDGHSNKLLQRPADMFNNGFDRLRGGYTGLVERILNRRWIFMGVFAVMVAIVALGFSRLPSAFLPEEDQGAVMTLVQLPVGATLERTSEVMRDVTDHYTKSHPDEVRGVFTVSGFSFAGSGQNMGMSFTPLVGWDKRTAPGTSAAEIGAQASGQFAGHPDAMVFAVVPPPIPELGNASGFDLFLQDRSALGHERLLESRNQLLGMAAQSDALMDVRPNGQEDNPQFKINIDYRKAQALGVETSSITSLFSTALGGSYVNDFIDRGRVKQVYVQGDAQFRMQPEDIGTWYVRNATGAMTPLKEIVSTEWEFGSPQLQRYNGISAVNIQGSAAPGASSGNAMDEMESLISQLPAGTGFEWTGISAQERESGAQAPALYALSVLFIFLCLAALYESWTIPVSVLLVAPLGVAGAVAAAHFRGLNNDVFFQVGLLTTIGLASKNAILIVEFARSLEQQGKDVVEAALEAAKMRLRPILMTSLAFGFGVMPLALATGAGAGARVAIGTAVVGGMIAATVFGIFFAPLFYVIVRKVTGKKTKEPETQMVEAQS